MSTSNAAQRYQAVKVATCSPAQLVAMLFDGAIRFAEEAAAAMQAKDRGRAGERIGRSHAIVEELLASLDRSQAEELCDNLTGLYTFCMSRLLAANLEQNPAILGEVVGLLTPLREAWWKVARAP